jgi:hypothetical protein
MFMYCNFVMPTMTESDQKAETITVEEATTKDVSGSGVTSIQDWGSRNGQWVLPLSWSIVNCNSRVFVSISEVDQNGCGFIGGARYTVHNVAVRNGGIDILVTIDWNTPIRTHVSYLVINP